MTRFETCKTLAELRDILVAMTGEERRANSRELTDLPTFGGEPVDRLGVFSWDETSLLIQDETGWEIVQRGDETTVFRCGDGSTCCPDCWPRVYPETKEPVYGWTDGECDHCGTDHNEN